MCVLKLIVPRAKLVLGPRMKIGSDLGLALAETDAVRAAANSVARSASIHPMVPPSPAAPRPPSHHVGHIKRD